MNKYLVEFLGTLFIVFVALSTGNWLAIGLAVSVAIFFGASVSGGAYNPAVAIVLYNTEKLAKSDLVPYILVEILGALAAFHLYKSYVNKA
jgi:aquaporin Z